MRNYRSLKGFCLWFSGLWHRTADGPHRHLMSAQLAPRGGALVILLSPLWAALPSVPTCHPSYWPAWKMSAAVTDFLFSYDYVKHVSVASRPLRQQGVCWFHSFQLDGVGSHPSLSLYITLCSSQESLRVRRLPDWPVHDHSSSIFLVRTTKSWTFEPLGKFIF